jgi:ABC-type transport system substrate-binding protein
MKKIREICFFSLLTFLTIEQQVQAQIKYVRPIPDIPIVSSPASISDVFSASIARQIHCTLFQIDHQHNIKPDLVDDFTVSKDGKIYIFKLRDKFFHNGETVTSFHVKSSIEAAMRLQAVGFRNLSKIKGIEDFLLKKESNIVGIQLIDSKTVRLVLEDPYPNLIDTFVNIQFAIYNQKNRNGTVGCGDFKVEKATKGSLLLTKAKKNSLKKYEFDRIEFKMMTKSEAFEAYKQNLVQDLFFYFLTESELKILSSKSLHKMVSVPKTYAIFLNQRKLSLDQRIALFSIIDPAKLIETCYKGQTLTKTLVPKGYLGSIDTEPKLNKNIHEKIRQSLTIPIVESVGQEECVQNFLQKIDIAPYSIQAPIISQSQFIDRWKKNKIQGIFAYVSSEDDSSIMNLFDPDAEFPVAPSKSQNLEFFKTYLAYSQALDVGSRQIQGQKLNEMLSELAIVLPIFHPNFPMVYSNKLKFVGSSFQGITGFPITVFENPEYAR